MSDAVPVRVTFGPSGGPLRQEFLALRSLVFGPHVASPSPDILLLLDILDRHLQGVGYPWIPEATK